MIAELTDMNHNMTMSIDVIPIPTDEAVREVENRILGVETNATNWQRRQNANNNFSAVLPYDLEQQRKENKRIFRRFDHKRSKNDVCSFNLCFNCGYQETT